MLGQPIANNKINLNFYRIYFLNINMPNRYKTSPHHGSLAATDSPGPALPLQKVLDGIVEFFNSFLSLPMDYYLLQNREVMRL